MTVTDGQPAALGAWLSYRTGRVSALGTLVGLVGSSLLIFSSFRVCRADCFTTLAFETPLVLLGLGVVAGSVVCYLFVGWRGPRRRENITASLVVLLVIPATFFLVALPLATSQRRSRHVEQMNERTPVLMCMVAQVEASRARLGQLPADDSEFSKLPVEDRCDPQRILGCCWIARYRKIDSHRFKLVYRALDVVYAYDSGTPDRGWYPNDEEADL